jgi:hypothetical protein
VGGTPRRTANTLDDATLAIATLVARTTTKTQTSVAEIEIVVTKKNV